MRVFTRFAGRALAAATSLVLAGGVLAGAAAPAGAEPGEWTDDAPGWGWLRDTTSDDPGIWYDSPHGTYFVPRYFPEFVSAHGSVGGGRGVLGYPVGDVVEETHDGIPTGDYQIFERGVIYGSYTHLDSARTYVVPDDWPTAQLHRASGGGSGELGYPRGDAVQQAPGWWYQEFENGYAYVSPHGGYTVLGAADRTHRGEGGGGGLLGYPIGPRRWDGPWYSYQTFERGTLYCNPKWGNNHDTCSPVTGGFTSAYASQGGGRGWLGYPLADESFNFYYWTQWFERGYIHIYPNGRVVYR